MELEHESCGLWHTADALELPLRRYTGLERPRAVCAMLATSRMKVYRERMEGILSEMSAVLMLNQML